MQFAKSVGASIDADRLELDQLHPDEGDPYPDQRRDGGFFDLLLTRKKTSKISLITSSRLVGTWINNRLTNSQAED